MIDPNAGGNAVHSTTRQKISHTWLTSHTGPTARLISARGCGALARAASDEVPESGAEIGSAENGVRGHGQQQDRRDEVGEAHASSLPAASGVASGGETVAGGTPIGPYGPLGTRVSPSAQRRDMTRSVSTVATPISA